MNTGLMLLYIEIGGTIIWALLRLRLEKFSWRIGLSFLWPIVVLCMVLGLLARWMGGKDWDKTPWRDEDADKCPVCHKGELIPFEKLEERAGSHRWQERRHHSRLQAVRADRPEVHQGPPAQDIMMYNRGVRAALRLQVRDYANPAGSTYIITSRTETVTVTDPAKMLDVAHRVAQTGSITIREVFPDGSGRWIVPPAGCDIDVVKPPGPPIAQPEPEPIPKPLRPGWQRVKTDVERYTDLLYTLGPESVRPPADPEAYEARIWYWLVNDHNFSEQLAADHVRRNIDAIEQQFEQGTPEWNVAAQLARVGYGERIRARRRRRPTWECPMPQTLLVAGVDVISETKRLIAVVPELQDAPMPSIYVRRNTTLRQRMGAAVFARNHIRLTDAPEIDRFDVVDTLSHELAHLNAFRLYQEKGHGRPWQASLEHIAFYGYNVRIRVTTRYSDELATILRGGPPRRRR